MLEVLKTDSAESNIYNTLSMIETEQKNYSEAMRWVNKALEVALNQPYFLNNRGYIFLGLNDLAKAEEDINKSIGLDPYNGWAYRNKGIFYLIKNDNVNAERLLKQALDMDPYIDKIHFYYGMVLMNKGNQTEACEQFNLSEEMGDQMLTADLIKKCK